MCCRRVNDVSFESGWDKIIESMFPPQEICDFPGTPGFFYATPCGIPL
jgi:hypothetical protein